MYKRLTCCSVIDCFIRNRIEAGLISENEFSVHAEAAKSERTLSKLVDSISLVNKTLFLCLSEEAGGQDHNYLVRTLDEILRYCLNQYD